MSTSMKTVKKLIVASAVSTALLTSGMASYAGNDAQNTIKEGWKEGVIDGAMLFNTNLNSFDIDVEVSGSQAVLTGFVDSDTSRALAEEVALSVDGITAVDNQLEVNKEKAYSTDKAMDEVKSTMSDAAITAKVKSKLLANGEASGLGVNVDTKAGVVTLKGQVGSEAERDLIYYITRNTEGVRSIDNALSVEADS